MSRIAHFALTGSKCRWVDVMGVAGAGRWRSNLRSNMLSEQAVIVATSAGMLMVPGNPASLYVKWNPLLYRPDYMAKHFKLWPRRYGSERRYINP
jgi:hypothetical protein